jgi:uracil-DNA glycosylase
VPKLRGPDRCFDRVPNSVAEVRERFLSSYGLVRKGFRPPGDDFLRSGGVSARHAGRGFRRTPTARADTPCTAEWVGVTPAPLSDLVAPDWAAALAPVEPTVSELGEFLRSETAGGHRFLPAGENILRAFRRPMADVRVLLVGQDPYPTPGHPVGLCFSVERTVRPLPASLQNIYRELRDDLGIETPDHGDLSSWADQGVLLLNRVLTVRAGAPASHRGKGWESVTDLAIAALVERGGPLVAILWGRDAQTLQPRLGDLPIIASVHPSPLSASRGFFGSRPFSRTNAALAAAGADPVDWRIR